MRFKALPESSQIALAEGLAEFVNKQPADLLYPTAEPAVWWGALLHFNVRLRAANLRAVLELLRLKKAPLLLNFEAFEKVVDAVEYVVLGPAPEHGTCDCCGETY